MKKRSMQVSMRPFGERWNDIILHAKINGTPP